MRDGSGECRLHDGILMCVYMSECFFHPRFFPVCNYNICQAVEQVTFICMAYMIEYILKNYENRFATSSYRGTFAISPMVARVGGVLSILATAALTSDALTF